MELRVEAKGDVVILRPASKTSAQRWLSGVAGCVKRGDPVDDLETEHREEVERDARRRP